MGRREQLAGLGGRPRDFNAPPLGLAVEMVRDRELAAGAGADDEQRRRPRNGLSGGERRGPLRCPLPLRWPLPAATDATLLDDQVVVEPSPIDLDQAEGRQACVA